MASVNTQSLSHIKNMSDLRWMAGVVWCPERNVQHKACLVYIVQLNGQQSKYVLCMDASYSCTAHNTKPANACNTTPKPELKQTTWLYAMQPTCPNQRQHRV